MKTFYILRGCSGSGKTTFAKTLFDALPNSYWAETDKLLYNEDGVYDWSRDRVHWAHHETAQMLEAAFFVGYDNIILSDTSAKVKFFNGYLEKAKEHGYKIVSLVVENRHGNESIHGVDERTLELQRQRVLGCIKLTAKK